MNVPPLVAAVLAGLFGLVFGSFANVVIYRLPRAESLASPPSRCPGCGAGIKPYDNVPVLSWLVLRGRCRRCHAPISITYPIVELICGLLWFVVTLRLWQAHPWAVPAYLVLAFVCLVLTVIDARTKLLPNAITYPAWPIIAALLLVASLAEHDPGRMLRALAASAGTGLLFLALKLVVPRGMGLGDVKFVPSLALALGWLSWGALLTGFFVAFLLGGIGGVVGLVVLRLSRKHQLPFGPWLAAGGLIGCVAGGELASWYLRVLTGAS